MMTNVRVTKLPNGTRIITSSEDHVESAAIGIWVGVGGRYESAKMSGASHFLEHLLFKGTGKRSSSKISQDIEGCGGYLNAFTQEESTCYYAKVAYDKIWRSLDVLSDMYLNSKFVAAEVERERGVILEEIMMYRDQPHHLVSEMLSSALWNDHPLGVPIIGYPDTVKGMKRKDIVGFWKEKYHPGNTVFAFAGRVDHDKCVEKVRDYMGGLKRGSKPRSIGVSAKTGQQKLALLEKDVEQSHLCLGIRVFGREDKRRYPLRVMNTILGENMSSRLFQVVREKHGLAYSIHSSSHLYRDSGVLAISAGLDRNRYGKGLELIIREISKMKQKPVGVSELKRAKEYITGQMRLAMESTSTQMISLGDSMLSYDKFVPREEVIANIESVTADDIQRVANAVLRRSRTSLALVVPALKKGDPHFFKTQINSL